MCENDKNKNIIEKIDRLIKIVQKQKIIDILELLEDRKKMLFRSFWSGVVRGVGMGIGFTIFTAVIIYFLQKIIRLNIPVIGNYISDIIEIVNVNNLGN